MVHCTALYCNLLVLLQYLLMVFYRSIGFKCMLNEMSSLSLGSVGSVRRERGGLLVLNVVCRVLVVTELCDR